MARMYSHKRGKSGSRRPASKLKPKWVQAPPEELKRMVVSLAREGHSKSSIGAILRDRHGVPSLKSATGMTVGEILKEAGEDPMQAEDLRLLTRKAEGMRRHLERYKSDRLNVHNLQLVESKIRRLAKYYKRKGILPPGWKYE
jgi:small subunit ribosomal protein S15